jgi:hypothetical protein
MRLQNGTKRIPKLNLPNISCSSFPAKRNNKDKRKVNCVMVKMSPSSRMRHFDIGTQL